MHVRPLSVYAAVVLFASLPAIVQAQTPCDPEDPHPPPVWVWGWVVASGGRPGPTLVGRLRAAGRPTYLGGTDQNGRYQVTGVCPGAYSVDIVGRPNAIGRGQLTVADGDVDFYVVAGPTYGWPVALLAITLLLFAAGLLMFRHHNIVRSNRELLAAQVDNLGARILLESDPGRQHEALKLQQRAWDVRKVLEQWWPWEWFFWSRGRELAGWTRLHELERQVIAFLVPEERVVERAVYAEAELRQLTRGPATVVADRIRESLERVAGGGDAAHQGHVIDHLKQQLAEGLAIIYNDTDTKFAGLMEWHNKAMFLVYLSLIAIATLGIVFRHEELFLVGAVGGLMSRMTRSLFREDVPSDYGASWTTLFLSPLLGAIAGWVGIALIIWLRQMNVLDEELFDVISWDEPTGPLMIAMAFTLGFSERLFTSLLSKVEGKVQDELNKPAPPPHMPTPRQPGPAAPAGAGGNGRDANGNGAPSLLDRMVGELDVTSGERVAFVGPATSPMRATLVPIVGALSVVDATAGTLATHAPLDAVLFETPLGLDDVATVAAALHDVLRPDARVVVMGSSPATLFDADAPTQRAQGHAGPAVVKQAFVSVADLSPQDPPEAIGGTDPIDWILSFVKPAPGGTDR